MDDNKICTLVKELLPLYKDKSISNLCEEAVEEHLSKCNECTEEWNKIKVSKDHYEKNKIDLSEENLKFKEVAKRLRIKKVRNIAITILSIVTIVFAYNIFFTNIKIITEDMEPTFDLGETCVFSKASYWFSKPKSGDIVYLNNVSNGKINVVKRIVGVPGDKIKILDNKLYLNDKEYKTNGQVISGDIGKKEIVLGDGEYFVIGDNIEVSFDSRFNDFGLIKGKNIGGKFICKLKIPNPFVTTKSVKSIPNN